MFTHTDTRLANSHAMQWAILIAAILMLAQFVPAQQPIELKNADGGTKTIEALQGGGAKITSTDVGGNLVDRVTSEPSAKYGQGGTKVTVDTVIDGKEVTAEFYKDVGGHVREFNYTDYGKKDKTGDKEELQVKYDEKGTVKSYEKKRNNKGPGEKKPTADDNIGVVAADLMKKPDAIAWLRLNDLRVPATPNGIQTDVEQPKLNEPKKTDETKKTDDTKPSDKPAEKTEPKTPDNPSPRAPSFPSAQPQIVPGEIVKYLTNVKEFSDLDTIQFTAPNKDILEVYVPKFLYPGASVGSMHVIPSKASDGGLSFKNDKLQIGDTTVSIGDHKFGCEFKPGEAGKFRMVDSQGRSLGGVDFPITDVKDAPTIRDFPTSSTFGQLIGLDFPPLPNPPLLIGNGSDPFEVKIGDQEMPIIAANRFGLVTREDYNRPGLTNLQIRIGEKVITIPLRVLTLKLSAESLLLSKDQTTTVHIIAGGLEKLKAPAHMTIAASGVVRMTGATAVEIDPKMIAADGTYTTDRTLFAQSAGTFGVDVTVTVDKEPWDEQKIADSRIATTEDGNAGGSTKTSEKKEPTRTVDKKVSVADAEKRIKPYVDYIDKRFIQMTVAYRRADGAKETLQEAFKKNGVGYSMGLADHLAKTGLGQFWSDEGGPAYARSSEIFQRYLDGIRKEESTTESYLDSIDQAMEAWKQFDQQFVKQMQKLVDLYTKEALMFDELHAIDVKYTGQLEELLKKDPKPKKEIDELRRKEDAESKSVRDRLETTQKEIEKVKVEARYLADLTHFLQPK